jgi:alcohol dehydrogenase YqhD (iron-dependent ADH family)
MSRAIRRRILIVTDKIIAGRTEALARTLKLLGGRETAAFDGVEENPTFETIGTGSRMARAFEAELVIGLGGGSCLDAAIDEEKDTIDREGDRNRELPDHEDFSKSRAPEIGTPRILEQRHRLTA